MKNNNLKKWIVNGLTGTRVLATLMMPFLINVLSPIGFLILIGNVLLTDAIDGFLARRWEVSTIFGSLFDMGADKLLGVSILGVLSYTYPIMLLPLVLELGICYVNTNNALKGNIAKSKGIGKSKMWIVGISMTSLLLIGAAPEISKYLSNINIDVNIFKNINNYEVFNWLDNKLEIIKEFVIKSCDVIAKFFINNKKTIENIVIPSSIIAETATLIDYRNDSKKLEDNNKLKIIEELKKYKEYVKKYGFKNYMSEVMFDNDYYTETINEPLIKKLKPTMNKKVDK